MPNLLDRSKLEQLLQSNWTSFIDASVFMRRVLVDARDAELRVVREKDAPVPRTKVTITSFKISGKDQFEIWAEFTVPHERGVVVGTHTYLLQLDGELTLQNTHGVVFEVEN